MKTKTLAFTMLLVLSGPLSAQTRDGICEIMPGVALTYPDMTLYSQETIAYHNDRVFDSKLGTLAGYTGVRSLSIGGTLEGCFQGAVIKNIDLPYETEVSRAELIYSLVLPYSGQARAFTFVYWEFRGATGVHKGMVNRNTERFVQGVTIGDQRFRDDGQALLK